MRKNGSLNKSRLQILALFAISNVAVLCVLSTSKNVGPSVLPPNVFTKPRADKRLQVAGENHTSVGLAAVIHDQITLEPKCQRPCTRRKSIIYFADSSEGLSDRKVMLRGGAELVLPPPSALLSKKT